MGDVPPQVVQEFAPSGRLRATINLGNAVLAQKDPVSGEPRGVSVDLACELGRRLGLPVDLAMFDAAGDAFAALRDGTCDVGFLAIDPLRASDLAFTAPYVVIEGAYMVPQASSLRELAEVDREGVRIAAGRNAAYDLYLSRTLKHARLVHAPTSPGAVELFVAEGLEAVAGVRQPLLAYAEAHPGYRVLDARFMAIEQAMALPRRRSRAAAHLRAFVEEMKASGFVASALARSGRADAMVGPPAQSDAA